MGKKSITRKEIRKEAEKWRKEKVGKKGHKREQTEKENKRIEENSPRIKHNFWKSAACVTHIKTYLIS